MDRKARAQQNDDLLMPFLRATGEAESQRLLGLLISTHAEPVIKKVIISKLRLSFSQASSTNQGSDAEDVYNNVVVKLIAWLRNLKNSPDDKAIGNFRGYVAVMTDNDCNIYLRQKYPRRWRLKNRLRYLLTHQQGFALWEEGDKWLCGFMSWRVQERSYARPEAIHQLRDKCRDLEQTDLADMVAAVFVRVNTPVELDDLVSLITDLSGIKDQPVQETLGVEGGSDRLQYLADPREGISIELDRRIYLQSLWAEICELPLRQRAALLLNLRDAEGCDVASLFPLTGVATIRQLAESLSMPDEQFAAMWNELPLDDATIALHLGVTRQQVINLRKSARERLLRRTKAFRGSV